MCLIWNNSCLDSVFQVRILHKLCPFQVPSVFHLWWICLNFVYSSLSSDLGIFQPLFLQISVPFFPLSFLFFETPIKHTLVYLIMSHNSLKLPSLSFYFSLASEDDFRRPVFKLTVSVFCLIRFAVHLSSEFLYSLYFSASECLFGSFR